MAKSTQTALDELDRPCAIEEIHDWLIPRARIALGDLPLLCFDSVERVVLALAENGSNGELPMGCGSACVRHFGKRSEQLQRISNRGVSVEHRFSFIEITAIAGIAHRWAETQRPRAAQSSYREYLRQVAQSMAVSAERERWRNVIEFVLDSPSSTPIIMRNVAYALVWCGYFSSETFATDEQLAERFFNEDRAEFNRFRQDGLRLLTMLLEFSSRFSMRGLS